MKSDVIGVLLFVCMCVLAVCTHIAGVLFAVLQVLEVVAEIARFRNIWWTFKLGGRLNDGRPLVLARVLVGKPIRKEINKN